MRKLEVTLETVTPVVLGGAEARGGPELRPPAFRGMMRYWFRAMAGGVLGDTDEALKQIKKKEAEVFGSPDEKTGGQSAVWVRLSTPPFNPKDEPLLPHKNIAMTPSIPPRVTPSLTLTLKPKAELDKIEIAIWSLLLGLTLGGIGKRSRRGFGSLRIRSVDSKPDAINPILLMCLTEAAQPITDSATLAGRIQKLIDISRADFKKFLDSPVQSTQRIPTFSLLKPDTHIVIWTLPNNTQGDYKTVLSPLMHKLSDLMRDSKLDESEPDKFAQAFGGVNLRLSDSKEKHRRASPLWVSTHRLQNNEWALVLTFFEARYLENNPGRQQQLVKDFMQAPPPGWNKTEVNP